MSFRLCRSSCQLSSLKARYCKYTGFIPKLESVVGETYGNATRKLLAHQAKLQQLKRTAVGKHGRWYLSNRMEQPYMHHSTPLAEDRNTTYEFLPITTNQQYQTEKLIYDGDPSTTSAIQSIEKLKADFKSSPESTEIMQLNLSKPEYKISSSTTPDLPSNKSLSKIVPDITIPETDKVPKTEGTCTLALEKKKPVIKRQSKLLSRSYCGPLPNYTGYIPGRKFSFGKTWGISTRTLLGRGATKPSVRRSFT